MPSTIDPIGLDTYKGLGVPLHGESLIRKQNSSNAAVTIMNTSGNTTGPHLLGIDYKAESNMTSLLTDLATWQIDGDGGFQALSGTTIHMELNSSGLYDGSTQVIDANGMVLAYNRPPVTAVGITSNISIASSQAGGIWVCNTTQLTNDTQFIRLPGAANITAGDQFTFLTNTTAVGARRFISSGSSDGVRFYAPALSTVAVNSVTSAGVQHATSGIAMVRFTAMSSLLWVVESNIGYSSETTGGTMIAENFQGNLVAATTST